MIYDKNDADFEDKVKQVMFCLTYSVILKIWIISPDAYRFLNRYSIDYGLHPFGYLKSLSSSNTINPTHFFYCCEPVRLQIYICAIDTSTDKQAENWWEIIWTVSYIVKEFA